MQLSEAEWKVMNRVWQSHPATAREVLSDLEAETSWAYTTVKTVMSRLVEKGALKVTMRANTSLYEPALDRGKARRTAIRSLVERAFDGALGPMMHFLLHDKKLTKRERKTLMRMIEEQT